VLFRPVKNIIGSSSIMRGLPSIFTMPKTFSRRGRSSTSTLEPCLRARARDGGGGGGHMSVRGQSARLRLCFNGTQQPQTRTVAAPPQATTAAVTHCGSALRNVRNTRHPAAPASDSTMNSVVLAPENPTVLV